MKHIMIALVVCAIPAMAFGQTVSCEDCTHDVSIYMGDGGLIAEADGVDKVTWVAECGKITRNGELEANDEGMVMVQFKDADLVCNADESRFQLGPVRDGGWHWLTDDTNSAVGALVNQGVLDNERTDIADPGPGVTMSNGRGAVLLKETATGRLGLLPDILPQKLTPLRTKCGYRAAGRRRRLSRCIMGDGGVRFLATSTNAVTLAFVRIPNGGTITRPAAEATGTATVLVDLWMNGSGHFSNDPSLPGLGHRAFAFVASTYREANRLTGVTYTVKVGPDRKTTTLAAGSSTAVAGVTYAEERNAAMVSIAADTEYCGTTANVSLPVTVTATVNDEGAATVTPPVKRNAAGGVAAEMSFTVVCRSASAAGQGQELVPDNPFPVDRGTRRKDR